MDFIESQRDSQFDERGGHERGHFEKEKMMNKLGGEPKASTTFSGLESTWECLFEVIEIFLLHQVSGEQEGLGRREQQEKAVRRVQSYLRAHQNTQQFDSLPQGINQDIKL